MRAILLFRVVVVVVGSSLGGKLNVIASSKCWPRAPSPDPRSPRARASAGWVFGFRLAFTRNNSPKRLRNVRLRKIAESTHQHSRQYVVCVEFNVIGVVQYKLTTTPSKHILNAQVAIRSPCCRQWFDCAECHAEKQDHELKGATEMIFACKKCRKVFRKDMETFEESDEYCPHCDNHFVLEAKEPQARLEVEGEDIRKDSRMIRDDRVKRKEAPTVWDDEGEAARLG